MKGLIRDIITAIVDGTWRCPECKGKPLGHMCYGCMYWDGVSLREIVDNGWTKEQAKEEIRSRKLN